MKDGQRLLPSDKFDVEAVRAAQEAGYPSIAPILEQLFDWTADSNWPVASPLSDFLITIGDPVIAPIARILRGSDGSHKEHCIRLVVKRLPVDVMARLEPELRRLAEQPSADDRREEADVAAVEALSRLRTWRGEG
jgi:hypothetical protein